MLLFRDSPGIFKIFFKITIRCQKTTGTLWNWITRTSATRLSRDTKLDERAMVPHNLCCVGEVCQPVPISQSVGGMGTYHDYNEFHQAVLLHNTASILCGAPHSKSLKHFAAQRYTSLSHFAGEGGIGIKICNVRKCNVRTWVWLQNGFRVFYQSLCPYSCLVSSLEKIFKMGVEFCSFCLTKLFFGELKRKTLQHDTISHPRQQQQQHDSDYVQGAV